MNGPGLRGRSPLSHRRTTQRCRGRSRSLHRRTTRRQDRSRPLRRRLTRRLQHRHPFPGQKRKLREQSQVLPWHQEVSLCSSSPPSRWLCVVSTQRDPFERKEPVLLVCNAPSGSSRRGARFASTRSGRACASTSKTTQSACCRSIFRLLRPARSSASGQPAWEDRPSSPSVIPPLCEAGRAAGMLRSALGAQAETMTALGVYSPNAQIGCLLPGVKRRHLLGVSISACGPTETFDQVAAALNDCLDTHRRPRSCNFCSPIRQGTLGSFSAAGTIPCSGVRPATSRTSLVRIAS